MSADISELLTIMARLRGPGGCPWDQEQTHASIKPQLVEECYEVLEAIDSGQAPALCEELGDLLLHIVFHAQLASERGAFDFAQVTQGICEKLVRRHPHVFGDVTAKDAAEVLQRWNEIKKKEKPERTGALDGVPLSLPALLRAQQIQKKASGVGFDWPEPEGARAKIGEELAEIQAALASGESLERVTEEMGDLLFAVVNYTRHLQIDAEQALQAATTKFIRRFEAMERAVQAQGKTWGDFSLVELDRLWNAQKKITVA